MNRLTSSSRHSMLVRIISSLVMLFICVPCVLFGSWFYFALIIVAGGLATYEIVHTTCKENFKISTLLVALAFVYCLSILPIIIKEDTISSIKTTGVIRVFSLYLSPLLLFIFFIAFFILVLIHQEFTLTKATFLYVFCLYIGLAMASLYYVRYLPNTGKYYGEEGLRSSLLLLYIVIAVCVNDIGAYFVGMLFGKHHMCPHISPHKTWEGFAGGVVFSFVFSFLFAFILSKCSYPILRGTLDVPHVYWIIVFSLLMPLAAVIGDLLFSLVKRNFGIKDFSNLIPGHGGILDRIDSLSFAVIFVAVLILAISSAWKLY